MKKEGKDDATLNQQIAEVKSELDACSKTLTDIQSSLQAFLLDIPNLPASSVPHGAGEKDNIKIRDFGKDDTYGYAMPLDDHSRPRFFELEINKKARLRRLLETVAHEMVHVKQYAKGELFEGNFKLGKHRWMGEWLSDNSNLVKEYWDHPWEVEAHGRECGLFVRWAEENKLGSRSWALDD